MSAYLEAGKVPPSLLPPAQPAIIPAQLGFLAIYNPSLGRDKDDSLEDQIVYYASPPATTGLGGRRRGGKGSRGKGKKGGGKKRGGEGRKESRDVRDRGQDGVEVEGRRSTDRGSRGGAKRGREVGDEGAEEDDGTEEDDGGKEEGYREREEERNEQLRNIGLAQGMVEFAKAFASEGEAVDTVETERCRVVLWELEKGWWVLASIDLTKLPFPPPPPKSTSDKPSSQKESLDTEYSSREVKPASLLLADLKRAYNLFLIHHAPSLSELWDRLHAQAKASTSSAFQSQGGKSMGVNKYVKAKARAKFVSLLGKYWDRFLATWNVMLHGNPIRDVFGGIRVAACGELGVGVGEEDRGSGERDVLEGFVGRVDGLVDLVVGRFGDDDSPHSEERSSSHKAKARGDGGDENDDGNGEEGEPWLGMGEEPGPEDGAVFLGVGVLGRKGLRDVVGWMEEVYTWGEYACGVGEDPSGVGRRERKVAKKGEGKGGGKKDWASVATRLGTGGKAPLEEGPRSPTKVQAIEDAVLGGEGPSIPPPVGEEAAKATQDTPKPVAAKAPGSLDQQTAESSQDNKDNAEDEDEEGMTGKFVSYLKLGYGTYWTIPGTGVADPNPESESTEPRKCRRCETDGRFLVGLLGDLDEISAASTKLKAQPRDTLPGSAQDSESIDKPDTETQTKDAPPHLELPDGKMKEEVPQEISERTLTLQTSPSYHPPYPSSTPCSSDDDDDDNAPPKVYHHQFRVLVYVAKPFITILLFDPATPSMQPPGPPSPMDPHQYPQPWLGSGAQRPYLPLHHDLSPLRKQLAASTRFRPEVLPPAPETRSWTGRHLLGSKPSRGTGARIYDLIYDVESMTLHSTIPSIPEPRGLYGRGGRRHVRGGGEDPGSTMGWSRVEALNTHMQLLSLYSSTRPTASPTSRPVGPPVPNYYRTGAGPGAASEWGDGTGVELERTGKTSRGWWVVWSRVVERDAGLGSGGRKGSTAGAIPEEEEQEGEEGDEHTLTPPGSPGGAGGKAVDWKVEKVSNPITTKKEIFLIRKAGEGGGSNGLLPSASSSSGGGAFSWAGIGGGGDVGGSGAGGGGGNGNGGGRLAQGIGVDTKRYVEGLLSLYR